MVTDVNLFHQQILSGQSHAQEIIFDDDGHGALVMDDGSVMMLQQWLTKQLWKGEHGELYVKDLSDPKKPFRLPWTVQLQKYKKKDVKLVVGAREVDFQAYLLHVRRGAGCSI